jgi:aminocarboxymuconate-semialdehyde decarboxylase
VIDFHSHAIPETILAAMRADPVRFGTRVEEKEGKLHLVRGKLRLALAPELYLADAKVEGMDRKGIEISVVSPGPQVFFYDLPEADGIAAARLVNDGIAAMAAAHPRRLRAMATLPLQNPDASIAEMERVAADHGFKGIEIATSAPGGEIADEKYRGVLRRARELGLTIFAHPNTVGAGGRLDCYYLTNLIGNPLETTIMVANLIFSGALDELEGLKMLLAHGGGFAPYQIGRFVHGHRVRPETRARTASSAKALLKRFYFDTITHDPQALRYLIDLVGAERIVVGSDAPFDMGDETPAATLAAVPGLTATEREQIARGTALSLLGET